MPRYRFKVEYVGTHFHGWQRQADNITVQECLETALSKCLRSQISITGSGRTDAGVHAEDQRVHFDFSGSMDCDKILNSLNGLTPETVCVFDLEECEPKFHCRYDAVSRYYQYGISTRRRALAKELMWYVHYPLKRELFQNELKSVLGKKDFNSFSIPRKDGKSTLCTVTRAELEIGEEKWVVHLQADRFLHKMVRSIVGACYDVARGHRKSGLVESILLDKNTDEWTWAPAEGLCLKSVNY